MTKNQLPPSNLPPAEPTFKVSGKLWIYPGLGAWHFLTVNKKTAKEIKSISGHLRRGFGSLKVRVVAGRSEWTTSIFPTKEGEYLLPIKAAVRKVENLRAEKQATAHITLI